MERKVRLHEKEKWISCDDESCGACKTSYRVHGAGNNYGSDGTSLLQYLEDTP